MILGLYIVNMRLLLLLLILCCSCSQNSSKVVYRVGRDPGWEPYGFGTRNSEINAFLNSLLNNICKKEECDMQILDVSPLQLYSSLTEGFLDAALTRITPSIETQDVYNFSAPLLATGPVLVVRIDSSITSLADLEEKKVGVNPDENAQKLLQKYSIIYLQPYHDMNSALVDLAQQRIDALLMGVLEAEPMVNGPFQDSLKIVTPPLTNEGIRMVALKQNEEIIKKTNQALRNLQNNGFYARLKKCFLNSASDCNLNTK